MGVPHQVVRTIALPKFPIAIAPIILKYSILGMHALTQ